MTTSLRSTITDLAASFATSVLDAIRQMSLDEILAETRGGAAPRAAARAAAPAKAAAAPAAVPAKARGRKGGRLLRRSAEDIASLIDQIVSTLAANPKGLRAEQIRDKLGLQSKELPRPLAEALSSRRITKTGEKRATTYFARAAGAAPKAAAKPAKAAKGKPGRKPKKG